jgi:hypothetical protein
MKNKLTKSDIIFGVIGIIVVIALIGVSIWAAFNGDLNHTSDYNFMY